MMNTERMIIPAIRGTADLDAQHRNLVIPERISVDFGGFQEWVLEAFCARTGCVIDACTGADAFVSIERDSSLTDEMYRLRAGGSGIRIAAATERGVIWALTTLVQLMALEKEKSAAAVKENAVPCCVIEDSPRFSYRGQSLDVVRHFFDAEEVKRIIEILSLVKINVLHWHLTDDQGWRIEIRKYPELTKDDAFYTQEEIRDVVRYAMVRGIEVIPEIDMPGHMTAALHAYPELGCDGLRPRKPTGGGIFKTILCAGKDRTYRFAEDVLEEVTQLFPSRFVHIGGDEAPKLAWEACPDCRRKLAELGLQNFDVLQSYFTERIVDMLAARGKKAICWNEVLEGGADPEKIQIQYWMPDHPSLLKDFAAAGGKWVFSDMFALYFDYPHAINSVRKVYLAEPSVQGFGGQEKVQMDGKGLSGEESARTETDGPAGEKTAWTEGDALAGMESCMWTERVYTPERLEKLLFPRALALAENAWSGPGSYTEFRDRLLSFLPQLTDWGMQYTDPDGWVPGEERAAAQMMEYMQLMAETSDPDDINELSRNAGKKAEDHSPDAGEAKAAQEEGNRFRNAFAQREKKISIRPYQPYDRRNVEHVCMATASAFLNSSQQTAEATLDNYCHYYIEQEPENCFVLSDENNDAVGYIFCAKNFDTWSRTFAEKYLEATDNPLTKRLGEGEISSHKRFSAKYPAHLHIDILPEYQRGGWGSKLVDTLLDHLKSLGVGGIMLEAGADNEKGIRFYKKYGFEILEETEGSVSFGMLL